MTEFRATTPAKYKLHPDLYFKHAWGRIQAAQLKIAELHWDWATTQETEVAVWVQPI